MKNMAALILLLFSVCFIAPDIASADEASPSAPTPEIQNPAERAKEELKKSGLSENISVQSSKPLPTVVPTPEYRKLPAYDILPRRAREEKV